MLYNIDVDAILWTLVIYLNISFNMCAEPCLKRVFLTLVNGVVVNELG